MKLNWIIQFWLLSFYQIYVYEKMTDLKKRDALLVVNKEFTLVKSRYGACSSQNFNVFCITINIVLFSLQK